MRNPFHRSNTEVIANYVKIPIFLLLAVSVNIYDMDSWNFFKINQ